MRPVESRTTGRTRLTRFERPRRTRSSVSSRKRPRSRAVRFGWNAPKQDGWNASKWVNRTGAVGARRSETVVPSRVSEFGLGPSAESSAEPLRGRYHVEVGNRRRETSGCDGRPPRRATPPPAVCWRSIIGGLAGSPGAATGSSSQKYRPGTASENRGVPRCFQSKRGGWVA